ncbi:hypothetical protein CGC57_04845 [Capnocytophaga sputigena]|nr:hypothetical protein CGC57_04845 [Capnocytophaga sputigena]
MLNIISGKSNIFTPFTLTTFCKTKYYCLKKQLSPHSLLKFFHTYTCIVFFFFVLLCDLWCFVGTFFIAMFFNF